MKLMGRPKSRQKTDASILRKLYIEQSKSIREVARELGIHPDTVHYWLKKYAIETRTMAKRSKLLKYSLLELKEGVKKKGIRGYAKKLGVNASTLSRFLRSEKE